MYLWNKIEFHRILKISKILNFTRANVHFKPCPYQVYFRVEADRFPASNIPSWSKFSQCRLFISRTYLTSDPNRQYRSPILGHNSRTRFGAYQLAKYTDHTEFGHFVVPKIGFVFFLNFYEIFNVWVGEYKTEIFSSNLGPYRLYVIEKKRFFKKVSTRLVLENV